MPSNNTGFEAGRLFGMFPDRLAHLHSVDSPREPKIGIPWALDNGVFGAWSTGREWTKHFPRVHVGRVNSRRLLEQAESAGAESCDGTGWFRDPTRTLELESYLSAEPPQPQLFAQ
jgi:hypothetical protein